MCTCQKVLGIITIIICILLFGISGWYWWYLFLALEAPDYAALVLYAISGVLLILMAILGIVAVIKSYENLICYFGVVMIVMCVFSMIQVGLTIWSSKTCNNKSNPFTFICKLENNDAVLQYWIPTGSIIVITLLAFIFAMILRRMWRQEEEEEIYY